MKDIDVEHLILKKGIKKKKLTAEAAASLLPPYSMPANTPTTVAVPQFTGTNFGVSYFNPTQKNRERLG